MMLFVTRHGQTEWNFENRVCGVTNVKLTEKGIKQASELSTKLEGYKIDLIISSPLERARKTAEILSCAIGQEIIIDNRLIEQNYGVYEGVSRDTAGFKEDKKHFSCKLPGGESVFQVVHRVFEFIDDLTVKFPEKNILVVAHGSVCRVIHTYFHDLSNEEFYDFYIGNCEWNEYKLS